jgi:hypothetical protein
MNFYFYKTTNLINGKYYYGSGQKMIYFGSGRDLKNAIKKYGEENFKFEILKYFETRQEAYDFEERFLHLYNIKDDKNSYNLTNFGCGGNRINYQGSESSKYREISKTNMTKWNKSEMSRESNRIRLLENNPMDNLEYRDKAVKALNKWKCENEHPMKGKNHSDESRKKMSETRKERGIIPYNKGKKSERESICDSCKDKFTKQGLKRHIKTCKSNKV